MKEWTEIRQWRKATRAELLAQRLAIPRSEKLFRRPIIAGSVTTQFPELRHACIGFSWPFKGEIDLRHPVRDFIAQGAEAALPVVVEKGQPLAFWAWGPDRKSVVSGKSVSVRVDLGGSRIIIQQNPHQ